MRKSGDRKKHFEAAREDVMGKINWGRVLLGGLLAGVIINLFEYLTNGVVLAKRWNAAMMALGREGMSNMAIAHFIIGGFILGIGAIWVYAIARPRFGPGPKTALCTAFGYWIFAYALPNFETAGMHLFPRRLLLAGTVVGLVELLVASLAGAAVYKE
jgi:hypothetical protein